MAGVSRQVRKSSKREHHIFTVGSPVEVLADEPDYGGVFFKGTVVESTPPSQKSGKRNSDNNKLLVEYRDLVVEEGGSVHLKEYVDVSLVRPEPPAFPERVGGFFEVGEQVDAFYNDGWWTGVVTRRVEGEGRKVTVSFPNPPDVREFEVSNLRPHVKWVNGTWITFTPEKQGVPVHSSIDGVHHDQGLKLNLMNNQSQESPPVNQNISHVTKSVTKRRHSPEPQAYSLSPKKLKEGDVLGARQQVKIDRMLKEMGSVSDIRTEYQLCNNLSLWKRTTKKRSNIGAAQTAGGKMNLASENIEKMMQPLDAVVIGGKNHPSQDVENKLAQNEAKPAVIVGLPVTDMVASASGKSRSKKAFGSGSIVAYNLLSDREHQLNNSTYQKKDGRSSATDSIKQRRKGKPRKYLFKGVQSPLNGISQKGDLNPKSTDKDGAPHSYPDKSVVATDEMPPDQEKMALDGDKFVEGHSGPVDKIRQVTERSPAETHDGNSDDETLLSSLRKQRVSKSQKDHPKASGENMKAKTYDAAADTLATGAPGLKFCDGPLSKWKEISSIRSMEQEIPKDKSMENRKAQRDGELLKEEELENNQQSSASANKASIIPNDEAGLLFVKTDELWRTLESLEAFKKIPQRPHFRPLEKIPERSREPQAIGLMVLCSSTMREVLNLRITDPMSISDSILETLAELETHGFNVRVAKDRVNEFIAIKDKQCNHVEKAKKLIEQISKCEGEKRQNGEEIVVIEEKIQKLQERLMLIKSGDAKADEKIAYLKTELRNTENEINNAGRDWDFEAASSW